MRLVHEAKQLSNESLASIAISSDSKLLRSEARKTLALRLARGVNVAHCGTCTRITYHSKIGACITCVKRNIRLLVRKVL